MAEEIRDLTDDAAILSVLERDRRWAAYALCDLDPPYRAHSRFVGALRDGHPVAVVLLYTPPTFTAVLPCGDTSGIGAIMARVDKLPRSIFLLVRGADLPAVEMRYRVDSAWVMLRMTVAADDLPPPPPVDAEIVALTGADLPALEALYALHPDTVFEPSMLQRGIYYGAYRDGELVAVAGTHAISRRHRVAAIGNVFTHPTQRGRGLAQATTGAVARALARAGIREIALNVAEDNLPAVAAYSRLGFTVHQPYCEGHATLL